jgi:hypothetical protein
MGFKSLIERQVQGAMRTLGTDSDGLARAQTYIEVTQGVYDPVTRSTQASTVSHADVPMVLARFSIEDMDREVRPKTDRKLLIAALDLTPIPKEDDRVLLEDGSTYDVVRLMSDPASALHTVHVRFRSV